MLENEAVGTPAEETTVDTPATEELETEQMTKPEEEDSFDEDDDDELPPELEVKVTFVTRSPRPVNKT